jgi:hypothetical protein
MIYRYTFLEQAILVSKDSGDKIRLLFEPEYYTKTRRYSLSDIFAQSAICREIYAGMSDLPTISKPSPYSLASYRLHSSQKYRLFVYVDAYWSDISFQDKALAATSHDEHCTDHAVGVVERVNWRD